MKAFVVGFCFVLRQIFFSIADCPGTWSVEQADLELTKIGLPLLELKACSTLA